MPLTLRTLALWALLALTPALPAAWLDDAWLDPALLEAHSLEGGSGFVHVPLPQSLPKGLVTGGIHRYRLKLGRGFGWGLEAGGQIELEGWQVNEVEKRNLLYARWAPWRRPSFSASVGVESVGFEDLGFRSLGYLPVRALEDQERAYASAGGAVPGLDMLYWAAGYAGGPKRRSGGFGALAIAPFAGFVALAELEDYSVHVGMRMLLSTQIKLDLSLSRLGSIHTNEPFANVLDRNLRFGISYSEAWP